MPGEEGAIAEKNDGSAAPIHARIRADVMEKIQSGAWPPGHRIPYEHELMEQYGCSRMTVNKAISGLAEAGLIARRKRAGSFVARPRIEAPILDVPDTQAEIEGRGQIYAFKLISRLIRHAAADQPVERELAGNGKLLAIDGVHFADGQPFAFEHRLISLAAVPGALDADFALTSPGAWLLQKVAWTQAQHGISAVHANAVVARHVGIQQGVACLQVERETWLGDKRITFVRQIFPGDTYSLYARFAPPAHGAS